MFTLEEFIDKISDTIIINIDKFIDTSDYENTKDFILDNQKTIRDGIVQGIRSVNERMVVYQRDVKANQDDFNIDLNNSEYNTLENVAIALGMNTNNIGDISVSISAGGLISVTDTASEGNPNIDITNLIYNTDMEGNIQGLNVSQYIQLNDISSNYDIAAAKEYLDTTIFELLPIQITRQQQINNFFNEYEKLKGGFPDFILGEDGLLDPPAGQIINEVSYLQNNDVDDSSGTITRLNVDSNNQNQNKTLEYLRNDLNEFLKDIDQETEAVPEDERPEYENKSEGYLKIRSLNQAIIVRRQ